MTDEQILKKAIENAIENGYMGITQFHYGTYVVNKYYYSIIFSHDFAKAFWKIKKVCLNPNKRGEALRYGYKADENIWRTHLQQMVLTPEPLKYLERFLEK